MRSKNKKLSARNKELGNLGVEKGSLMAAVHQLQSLQSIQARLQELEEENAALEAQNKKLEDNIAELLTKDGTPWRQKKKHTHKHMDTRILLQFPLLLSTQSIKQKQTYQSLHSLTLPRVVLTRDV